MRRIALVAACCGAVAVPLMVRAQDGDVRPLLDRLDRLERDMNLLQRQVYRGAVPGSSAIVAGSTQNALGTEVRLSQMEDQMRTLTGRIEETSHQIADLRHQFEKLASDIDVRLQQLEHPGAAGASTPDASAEGPPVEGQVAAAAAPPPPPSSVTTTTRLAVRVGVGVGAGAEPGRPASQSGTLGTLVVSPGGTTAAAPPPAATQVAVVPPNLPAGTPQEQYDAAFGLLRQSDYPAAEQALRAFVQRYPNDPLAGNAQYWLGQTYYVRRDYHAAAAAFAEGYQKYPKSGKAPDILLSLALSLSSLNQKPEACTALGRLDRDFPAAPTNVKDRATLEKRRLGC
jgi:tol-pal system protein YbgF